ncbi:MULTISPECIES: ABC transporter ATP-binding protein [Agromyces]|uniref:ABC transporter ATP-binding protein n=1 Tax=Agromyces lapidis TaxID=279574 RepID=A0ABV5SR86_9MICO|nr:ABC transporter ATP-binding protein [Agromyces lapidis]
MPKTSELNPPRIIVEGVRKTYTLRHTQSFKETFVAWIRRKKTSTSFQALNGIDITVGDSEAIALLGYNGSGKSTLLKLVSGVLRPDAGRILTRGRVAGLIEVGAGFHPDLSGRENVYLNAAILGMSKDEIDARFDEIVEFSEIGEFIDTEVKHYSSGMFVRLAFSVAIHTELDILLVDEVLAVGDAPFREKCKTKIREIVAAGKTLFIVSHDLGMVSDLCSRGIVLRRGEMVFDGAIGDAITTLKASTR